MVGRQFESQQLAAAGKIISSCRGGSRCRPEGWAAIPLDGIVDVEGCDLAPTVAHPGDRSDVAKPYGMGVIDEIDLMVGDHMRH